MMYSTDVQNCTVHRTVYSVQSIVTYGLSFDLSNKTIFKYSIFSKLTLTTTEVLENTKYYYFFLNSAPTPT
jgi:hypothetical protein